MLRVSWKFGGSPPEAVIQWFCVTYIIVRVQCTQASQLVSLGRYTKLSFGKYLGHICGPVQVQNVRVRCTITYAMQDQLAFLSLYKIWSFYISPAAFNVQIASTFKCKYLLVYDLLLLSLYIFPLHITALQTAR